MPSCHNSHAVFNLSFPSLLSYHARNCDASCHQATLHLQGTLQSLRLMKANKRKFTILDGLSGRITPGRMTLLLGPPGSGKSTLLNALAGKLRHSDLQAHTVYPCFMADYIPICTRAMHAIDCSSPVVWSCRSVQLSQVYQLSYLLSRKVYPCRRGSVTMNSDICCMPLTCFICTAKPVLQILSQAMCVADQGEHYLQWSHI